MAIDRDDEIERNERVKALLEQARELRHRAGVATEHARNLIERSRELAQRQERREQRDRLLKRATDALKMAQATEPALLAFRERRKKRA